MSNSDSSWSRQSNVGVQGQDLGFLSRNDAEKISTSKNVKGKEKLILSEDEETMELYSRARAQEKEILHLREQIALASIRESQLLNEKYALERKFSELRMALDEKQAEVITSASNELARRKGDLEVNLNLLNELKVAEEEKHIFTSSMLGILSEYGAWPHVTNASALSNSIKYLHDKLQLRIRTSHARLGELNSMIGNDARNAFLDKDITMSGQLPSNSTGAHGSPRVRDYNDGKHLESADDMSRNVQNNAPARMTRSGEIRKLSNSGSLLKRLPEIDRNVAGHIVDKIADTAGFVSEAEQRADDQFSQPQFHDRVGSFGSEGDGPGIEGFQVIGDARPGCKLLGCGYPVRGTSLCMFQWVRHYPDGTRHYIEGATNPDYIVTADDVDKLIAVECIPMDEHGRQGELVRLFANEHMKITCDEEMQEAIDTYISKGQATFNVMILLDSSENWEPVMLSLRRSGFQVKAERKQEPIISEKYSKDLLIKIPGGILPQFVLTCSNGSSYPFSTNDVRLRDTVVLTMRLLQSKALDEKRKSKV